MPLELVAANPGDIQLARFFALAVDLAYFNDEGPAKFKEELALDATLEPPEIEALTSEMLAANAPFLPQFER